MISEDGRNIIFIVGSPRSGTTWIQRVLSSHENIVTGQESNLFNAYISRLWNTWNYELNREQDSNKATGRGGIGLPCYLTEEAFIEQLKAFSYSLISKMTDNINSDQLFLDKTPSHALHLSLITKLYPKCKIIVINRHPKNVVKSILHASKTWGKGWAPKNLDDAIEMWKKHSQAPIAFLRKQKNNSALIVNYEKLKEEPIKEFQKIYEFIGLTSLPKDFISEALRKNAKSSLQNNTGTNIEIRGEFRKRSNLKYVLEPKGFASKKDTKLSLIKTFLIWRKTKFLARKLGYKSSFSSYLKA
jgi:hypothetical protein